jgi:hypothetical protein
VKSFAIPPWSGFRKVNGVSRLEKKRGPAEGVIHVFSTTFQNLVAAVTVFCFMQLQLLNESRSFFLTELGFSLKIQIKRKI